jgi:carboxyl-terminal processing protease
MSFKRYSIIVILFLTVGLSGVIVSRWSANTIGADEGPYNKLKIFTEVMSLVKKNYVEEVDNDTLIDGAIKGMLTNLDPHSSYLTPDMFREMQIDTRGEFGGLGIQIGIKDGVLTIIAPIEDTPAYRAGVKAGDKIIKIEGESTKDMSLQDAVSKLRGKKGTPVTITVFREGIKENIDFTIVRDIIQLKSIKSKVIDNDIGYIKLTQFHEKSADELADSLQQLEGSRIHALILDLRNNPGGLLNVSIDVAGQFLPKKKLVVYTKDRQGKKVEYKTHSRYKHYDYPMFVLVNEGSASASEIVAGALRDWNRAVLLGTKTFGKGSVQTVIPLSDGSGLRLTTAKYYTPNDKSIQATGITPDIVVVAKEEKEKQEKTHDIVREQDLDNHLENEQNRETEEETVPDVIEIEKESEEQDIQLQRAVDLIKTWKIFDELKDEG